LRNRLIKPLGAPSHVPRPPVKGKLPPRPNQAMEALKYADLPEVDGFTWKMVNKQLVKCGYTIL
jgi:hypothetical protein